MTLATPLGIGGIIFIAMGLAIALAGIILLIANQNKPKEWYIWFLISMGTVMAIVGGVMLAIALADDSTLTVEKVKKTTTDKELE